MTVKITGHGVGGMKNKLKNDRFLKNEINSEGLSEGDVPESTLLMNWIKHDYLWKKKFSQKNKNGEKYRLDKKMEENMFYPKKNY